MRSTTSRQSASTGSKSRTPRGRLITTAVLLAAVSIAIGAWNRNESDLVPDEGLGYWLGAIGLACMVLLLGYSIRKHMSALQGRGRISSWFQIHMLLGLLGPVAILYHCNFRLGSLNSNVALFCALVVAASGVIGRTLYTRIHHGLSERKRTVSEMKIEFDTTRKGFEDTMSMEDLGPQLDAFEGKLLDPDRGVAANLGAWLLLGARCRGMRRKVRRRLASNPELDRAARRELMLRFRNYLAAIRRAASISVFEGFFGLWHVLHLPLAFLLFSAAAVHVLAVHMY